MELSEWIEVERRIDGAQIADGPCLLDCVSRSFIASLSPLECLSLIYTPEAYLRPRQLAPVDLTWLILAFVCGRGWGKTHAAAAWFVSEILACKPRRTGWTDFLICAQSEELTVSTQLGAILSLVPPWVSVKPELSHQRVYFPDHGVRLHIWSSARTHLRGLNLSRAWLDEVIAYPRGGAALFNNLRRALRIAGPLDTPARLCITTTPPTEIDHWLLPVLAESTTRTVRGTAREGAQWNPTIKKENVESWYAGPQTKESRRENDGAFVFGADGALFDVETIERYRVAAGDVPKHGRTVVAVDPATSSGADADSVGCAVLHYAGGHGYLLASFSERMSPAQWPSRVIALADEFEADEYIVESTGSGETAKVLLQQATRLERARSRYIRESRARGAKQWRAGPVAAAGAAGRFHVVGSQPDFEREATTWFPGAAFSPGSLDAAAHAWATVTLGGKNV